MTLFRLIAYFSRGTRLLSQKREWSSSPTSSAQYTLPAMQYLYVLTFFVFLARRRFFQGRRVSSLKKVRGRHLLTSPPQYTLPVMQYLYLITFFVVFAHRRFFQRERVPSLKKVRGRRPSTSPPQYTPACLAIESFLIGPL